MIHKNRWKHEGKPSTMIAVSYDKHTDIADIISQKWNLLKTNHILRDMLKLKISTKITLKSQIYQYMLESNITSLTRCDSRGGRHLETQIRTATLHNLTIQGYN